MKQYALQSLSFLWVSCPGMRSVQTQEAPNLNISIRQTQIKPEHVNSDQAAVCFRFGQHGWRGEMAAFSALAIFDPHNADMA